MATSAQSIKQARVAGGRDNVPQLQTVELEVTEAALDVFNNFIEHIAANALPKGIVKENFEASKTQLWRKKRFTTNVESQDPKSGDSTCVLPEKGRDRILRVMSRWARLRVWAVMDPAYAVVIGPARTTIMHSAWS